MPVARSVLERNIGLTAAVLGGAVTLPFLGSVGLWDPWETQYAEVARSMIVRGDLIHPFWQDAWFFSKPPLTMWLMLPGLWLTGAAHESGALSRYTEWSVRLPFAAISMITLALLSTAVSRLVSRRAALSCAFVLATMPLYVLLSRQTMTDLPLVGSMTCALACAAIAQLETENPRRSRWWWGFYAGCGFAALAKGPVGLALPALVLLVFASLCVLPWSGLSATWNEVKSQCRQMRLLPGIGLCLLIAAPWFVAMLLFPGVDNEGKRFWERFFIYDNFDRLFNGVHTTTPGGTFTYFIEQGGYAIFPWVALLPGALVRAMKLRFRSDSRAEQWSVFAMIWSTVAFALFTLSATKFHHYVFPLLPPVAVLIGIYIDELWEQTTVGHRVSLLMGTALLVVVGRDLADNPRHFIDLFTYNYDRPYPADLVGQAHSVPGLGWVNVSEQSVLRMTLALIGTACAALLVVGHRQRLFQVFGAGALLLALWLGCYHWVEMSHHWTQRDLFWRYYGRRSDPREPIAAFLMDWKGETFYSRNRVIQIGVKDYLAQAARYADGPGRKWMLVEHARLGTLRRAVGPNHAMTLVDPALNNKFVLVEMAP